MKLCNYKLLSLFIAAMLIVCSMSAFGQGVTTAAINGVVTDQNGNPLPAASIIAVHEPSGTQYGTTTRINGKYNLPGLRVGGPYNLKISYVGYKTQDQTIARLELGETYTLNIKLSETAIQLSNVTVTAKKTAIINENRTGAVQNVSAKQIQEIPTISRSFSNFAKLSPLFSGTGYSAAGENNRYNNIQIDGTQYNDLFGLAGTGTPGGQTGTNPISLDAIQEFQVVIAPFDVRLGGFTGGGINAITRSGTNVFHGSAYAYGRNQSLVSSKLGGVDKPVNDFKEDQFGFRLGGPIVKDKAFFFINGEITGYNQPLTNLSSNSVTDSVAQQIQSIMASRGFNIGSYSPFTSKQPSGKIFARLDFNLSENHKLSIHDNYVNAKKDVLGSRNSTSNFSFDSYLYVMKDVTNNLVAQLNSTFGNTMANELTLGYTTIRDNRGPDGALTPEVIVNDAAHYYMGTDQYSSANKLNQDIFEFTDNFTYYTGNHTLTFGTHNEFFSFYNLFIRSFAGYWAYNSLQDLINNHVGTYSVDYSRTSDPQPAASFGVRQYGLYAQDEWNVIPNVRLTFGLRMDVPTLPDTPAKNDSLSHYYPAYSTTNVPSGNILWSPRFGFNWDVNGDRTTQVRGGVGIFSGRPPYVWISNQYGNTGTTIAEIYTTNIDQQFVVNPANQPRPGTGSYQSEVDLSNPNLKFPQVLRYDIGVDHQLPFGFVGTAEFLYSSNINAFTYQKLNIININNPSVFTGNGPNDDRPLYGGTDHKNGNFNDIMYLTNTNKGYSYNFILQLQRNVTEGLSVSIGYTNGTSKDINSDASSQAQSQMRYSPIAGNPNNPALATSDYQIKNRLLVSLAYTHEFFKNAMTSISLFYNGQTGQPYSFTYYGDINGDGFDRNDLMYIPKNDQDILLGYIDNSGNYVAASAKTYQEFDQYINNNQYLRTHRGQISQRNVAHDPWNSYVDLRISQDIPIIDRHRLSVSLNILNLMNLLNSKWGWVETVGYNTLQPLTPKGLLKSGPNAGREVYSYYPPTNNNPEYASDPASRWQMQLGVRYTF